MCGIAGIVRWDKRVTPQTLEAMARAIRHRGPDGSGLKLLADGHVGLTHRRLSIIDLSPAGAQPMTDAAERLWISFNGMITNFKELRAELEAGGYAFRSHCDTEVIIAAYHTWGTDSFARLRGMFAFALWDDARRTLYLVRDQFGIKPLYVFEWAGGIAFGSEVKALLATSLVARKIRPSALRDFLYYRYVPYEETMFEGVRKLPPATWQAFHFDRPGDAPTRVESRRYWTPTVAQEPYDADRFQTDVEALLFRSVRNNLNSDVPLGIFLSGGYDSATVTDLASRIQPDIATFTIGFRGWSRSEHEMAAATAARLGTNHHMTMLDAEPGDIFAEGADCYDDPFGGTSFWPTKRISALSRKSITVALGGDGGDEIFGGYNWYPDHDMPQDDAIAGYLRSMDFGLMTGEEVAALCDLPADERTNPGDLLRARLQPSLGAAKPFQVLDLETFLPDVVLAKVDRAAMAHALEMRVPFLDPDLVDLVLSANERLYTAPGVKKPTLQHIVEPRLGSLLVDRPKQGFSAPLENYISFKDLCWDVMTGQAVKDGLFNLKVVQRLQEQERYRPMLALRILEAWYRRWGKET